MGRFLYRGNASAIYGFAYGLYPGLPLFRAFDIVLELKDQQDFY